MLIAHICNLTTAATVHATLTLPCHPIRRDKQICTIRINEQCWLVVTNPLLRDCYINKIRPAKLGHTTSVCGTVEVSTDRLGQRLVESHQQVFESCLLLPRDIHEHSMSQACNEQAILKRTCALNRSELRTPSSIPKTCHVVKLRCRQVHVTSFWNT